MNKFERRVLKKVSKLIEERVGGLMYRADLNDLKKQVETMVQKTISDAVIEDRERIARANPTAAFVSGLGDVLSTIDQKKLNKIPLPFES